MTHQPVSSSNIKTIGYDPASQTLEVVFKNGSVHQYAGVPPEKHQALITADSIGSHFHAHIRSGKYKSTKIR